MAELELVGVAVDLGGRRVLSDVDLSVAAGEFVGVVGPNGAGKTTLVRAMQGLLPLAAGRAEIAGRSPERAAGRVGYVPQRHDFAWEFPISVEKVVMTGRIRQVGWWRRPRARDWQAVVRALRLTGMTDLAHRPIGQLSGGQRQRALVARALAVQPSVLLLDEPFTGLDLPTQELLTDLFIELSAGGTTVVMTTHDIAAARHACPRLVIVNGGIAADSARDDLADASVWMRAFGVSEHSALLTTLGIRAAANEAPEMAVAR